MLYQINLPAVTVYVLPTYLHHVSMSVSLFLLRDQKCGQAHCHPHKLLASSTQQSLPAWCIDVGQGASRRETGTFCPADRYQIHRGGCLSLYASCARKIEHFHLHELSYCVMMNLIGTHMRLLINLHHFLSPVMPSRSWLSSVSTRDLHSGYLLTFHETQVQTRRYSCRYRRSRVRVELHPLCSLSTSSLRYLRYVLSELRCEA